MVRGKNAAFSLRRFEGHGYDKGRPLAWQAAWWVVLNVVFMAWWCPPAARPAILRLFGAEVGDRVHIREAVYVHWPWKLRIADDVWIGRGAELLNLEPITIDHDVCISQGAVVCTGSHDRHHPAFEYANAPVEVEAHAWIAGRSIVLPGASIPRGTVVPAGTVWRCP